MQGRAARSGEQSTHSGLWGSKGVQGRGVQSSKLPCDWQRGEGQRARLQQVAVCISAGCTAVSSGLQGVVLQSSGVNGDGQRGVWQQVANCRAADIGLQDSGQRATR